MGEPVLIPQEIPVKASVLGWADDRREAIVAQPFTVANSSYDITCVSMGNPHCITFIDEDVRSFPLEAIGSLFEKHELFPEGVNTEFVNIIDKEHLRMRVWERGSGETLACGTGTCATVVACVLNGLTEDEITVHLLGGDILVKYDRDNDTVWMTGPAAIAFEGTIEI